MARSRRSSRGDVLLIAGKGHETGQIVGGKTLPISAITRKPKRRCAEKVA